MQVPCCLSRMLPCCFIDPLPLQAANAHGTRLSRAAESCEEVTFDVSGLMFKMRMFKLPVSRSDVLTSNPKPACCDVCDYLRMCMWCQTHKQVATDVRNNTFERAGPVVACGLHSRRPAYRSAGCVYCGRQDPFHLRASKSNCCCISACSV